VGRLVEKEGGQYHAHRNQRAPCAQYQNTTIPPPPETEKPMQTKTEILPNRVNVTGRLRIAENQP